MLSDLAQAVLVRPGARPGASDLDRIDSILPMPALADDAGRASGDLRATADVVCQSLRPQAAWFEVRITSVRREAAAAILVIAGSSLAAACLLERTATVFAAPGDDSVTTARRQRDVSALVAALSAAGYDAGLHPVDAGDPASMSPAAWLERLDTRAFRRDWPIDAAIVFVVAAILSGVSLAMQTPGGSMPLLVAGSVVLGALCAVLQFLYAWNQWHERLVSFRAELKAQASSADLVEYRGRPIPIWAHALWLVMFGGAAIQAARDREWGPLVGLIGIVAAMPAYAALLARAWVRMDTDGIEGLGPRGRTRIAFADIEAIPAANELEPLFVMSRRDRIWISKQLDGREHLCRTLWDRVLGTHAAFVPAGHDLSESRLVREIRQVVERSRATGTIASTPLPGLPVVLRLVWRDPIRMQYRWQSHLFRHGRVHAARVVASGELFSAPRETFAVVASARVVFLDPDGPESTRAVWDRLSNAIDAEFAGGEASPIGDALSRLTPGIRPLPSETLGPGLWTARLVIDPRLLPLQYLRTNWLPVLVDRDGCNFVMPVPPALWPAPVRRAWLAGAPDAFDPAANAQATALDAPPAASQASNSGD